MIIGNFRYDQRMDLYIGEIKTLTVHRHIQIRAINKITDEEADYRVFEQTALGDFEFGDAWTRQDGEGKDFLSVRLSDPIAGIEFDAELFRTAEDLKPGVNQNKPNPAARQN
jgi:uncharacterized protein (DUF736 family)